MLATDAGMHTGQFWPFKRDLPPADIYHLDGSTTGTPDGRQTTFPSNVLDYQLYSPQTLRVRLGWILDSEDLLSADVEALDLQRSTSNRLSGHRPLIVHYGWRLVG